MEKVIVEGHPVANYFQENVLLNSLLKNISETDPAADLLRFTNIFNELATIEKRFARKENQLFPFLEKRGWNGPSQGMWSFHDNLRDQMRLLRFYIKNRNLDKIAVNTPLLVNGILRLMQTEETVLFPNALQILTDEDWIEMRKGEEEIGWMFAQTPPEFPATQESATEDVLTESFGQEKSAHFDEGYMTIDQVNLLLRTMPLDLTYVDENDRVIFYNRGEERVFPRSAGVIGREVKFCHPPKSVGTVLKILEEFRNGTKNEASFWINYKERLIYIRYFAVRDANKVYRGVIEMSQDITDIKKIEGEQRLLDWA
ncbi:MAG: DUF438 domain-containing protein [Flavobacterium sp.]|nr:MAG: DUF438 domain-containing protein [Flavobacterium sp.]